MYFIILPILCKKTEIKRGMMRSLEENSIEKFARSEHFLQGKESFFALEIRNCLIDSLSNNIHKPFNMHKESNILCVIDWYVYLLIGKHKICKK